MRNLVSEARQERRWSQQRLAEELGVSRQTVISIEKGRFDPSLPLAFRLAAVFERPLEELFFPEPVPEDTPLPPASRRASGASGTGGPVSPR